MQMTILVSLGRDSAPGRSWGVMGTTRTIALILVTLCALTSPARAIFMGVTPPGSAYNSVGMILPTTGHPLGTGTMVSRFVFLTAAQNVNSPSQLPSDYEFTLGPGMTAHATEIRVHPNFVGVDGLN